jgi:hypothetical protein
MRMVGILFLSCYVNCQVIRSLRPTIFPIGSFDVVRSALSF